MNKIPKDMFDSLRQIEQGKIFEPQLDWRNWSKNLRHKDSLLISTRNQSESNQVQHYSDIPA
nr:hypothetical protein [uncultured Desulfobacter sp.]